MEQFMFSPEVDDAKRPVVRNTTKQAVTLHNLHYTSDTRTKAAF